MQPACTIPPYDPESLKQLIGMKARVPVKANPAKNWYVIITSIGYCGPNSACAWIEAAGNNPTPKFGKPRWIDVKLLRWKTTTTDPLVLAVHKAREMAKQKPTKPKDEQ